MAARPPAGYPVPCRAAYRWHAACAPSRGRRGVRAPLRMTSTRHPRLIEIDARAWLARLSARDGRRVGFGDVRARDIDPIAELGFDMVWLTAAWTIGSGSRRLWRSQPSLRHRRSELLPHGSDDDIVGFAVRDQRLRAGREPRRRGRAGQAARPPGRGRSGADPRLRPQPHRAGASVGPPAPGLVRPRGRDRPIGASRRMVRGALRGPPLDRPRSRPELRAVAGYGPARLPPPGCPPGDDPDAARGRHALRRGGLLDGDARARRCLPVDLGRPVRGAGRGGGGLPVRRVLVARQQRRPRRVPALPAHRRGVLGPRMAAPAARLRLHVRLDAAGPDAERGSGRDRRPPPRGRRLPAPVRPAPRGSQQPADRGPDDPGAGARRSARRGGRPGHAPGAGWPDPGRPRAGARPVPARARRADRRHPARVLLPPAAGHRRRSVPARPGRPARADLGVARQQHPRGDPRPVCGSASTASSGSRSPT